VEEIVAFKSNRKFIVDFLKNVLSRRLFILFGFESLK